MTGQDHQYRNKGDSQANRSTVLLSSPIDVTHSLTTSADYPLFSQALHLSIDASTSTRPATDWKRPLQLRSALAVA